jgi:hypothetical protein
MVDYSLMNIEVSREEALLLLSRGNLLSILRDINDGHLVIIRSYLDLNVVRSLRELCLGLIGRWKDEYTPFSVGVPNNTRLHRPRPESIVTVSFNALNFYPWNDSSLKLFNECMHLYNLRASLVGKSATSFVSQYDDGYAARLALQFYPEGIGFFESHRDPFDIHQIAIPTIALSKYGSDFSTGGFYLMGPQNNKVYIDSILEPGDAIVFHSLIEHGVDVPDLQLSTQDHQPSVGTLSPRIPGRLMLLCAVNQLVLS